MQKKNLYWINHNILEKFSDLTITLYSECDYSGISSKLGPGKYDINKIGIPNDTISSIKIPNGIKVTLFENNFQGRKIILYDDEPCLTNINFNDITSTIVIEMVMDDQQYKYIIRGCENDTSILKCPEGEVIDNGVINYGKWDNDKCGFQPNETRQIQRKLDQVLPSSFTKANNYNVKVDYQLMDDPPNNLYSNSYEILYNCKKPEITLEKPQPNIKIDFDEKLYSKNKNVKVVRGCESESIVIDCNQDYIEDLVLYYGKWDDDKCSINTNNYDSKNKKYFTDFFEENDKHKINVKINNKLFGNDPLPGILKSYEIQYICINKEGKYKNNKKIKEDKLNNIRIAYEELKRESSPKIIIDQNQDTKLQDTNQEDKKLQDTKLQEDKNQEDKNQEDKKLEDELRKTNAELENRIKEKQKELENQKNILENTKNESEKYKNLEKIKETEKDLDIQLLNKEKKSNEIIQKMLNYKINACNVAQKSLLYQINKLKGNNSKNKKMK
jgi:hypothetical protein